MRKSTVVVLVMVMVTGVVLLAFWPEQLRSEGHILRDAIIAAAIRKGTPAEMTT